MTLTFIGDNMDRLHAMTNTLDNTYAFEYLNPLQIKSSEKKLKDSIVVMDLDLESRKMPYYIRMVKDTLPRKLIGVHNYTEDNIIDHLLNLGLTEYSDYLELRDHLKHELEVLE